MVSYNKSRDILDLRNDEKQNESTMITSCDPWNKYNSKSTDFNITINIYKIYSGHNLRVWIKYTRDAIYMHNKNGTPFIVTQNTIWAQLIYPPECAPGPTVLYNVVCVCTLICKNNRHAGISTNQEGRHRYLKTRNELSPDEKYRTCPTHNFRYGWNFREHVAEMPKHGRAQVMTALDSIHGITLYHKHPTQRPANSPGHLEIDVL